MYVVPVWNRLFVSKKYLGFVRESNKKVNILLNDDEEKGKFFFKRYLKMFTLLLGGGGDHQL